MMRLISIVPNITCVFITWQQLVLLTRMYAACVYVCVRNNLAAIKIVRAGLQMQNDSIYFHIHIRIYRLHMSLVPTFTTKSDIIYNNNLKYVINIANLLYTT